MTNACGMLARMTAIRLNFRLIDRLRLGLFNPRFLSRWVWMLFFLLALALAARWLSLLLAPRPLAALPATVSNKPGSDFRQQAAKIFGQTPAAGTGLAGYSLAGVYALGGGDGVAVFVSAQKQLSAKVGEEFAPGVRLARVERGQAVVSVNGAEQTLRVPEGVAAAPGLIINAPRALPAQAAVSAAQPEQMSPPSVQTDPSAEPVKAPEQAGN